MRATLRSFALLATFASATSFAFAQDAATQAGRAEAAQSPLSQSNQDSQNSATQNQRTQNQQSQADQIRTTQNQNTVQGARATAGQQTDRTTGAQAAGGIRDGAQAHGMSVSSFFAHKLRRSNEAEVELGRMASEKAQSEQVKKFAQMMVDHHSAMIPKLQQLEGNAQQGQGPALRQRVGQSEPDSQSRTTIVQGQGNVRRGQGNVRNSESGTDGEQRPQGAAAAGGASQATTTAGQTPGTATPGSPRSTSDVAAGQVVQASGVRADRTSGEHVPHQLVAVFDQAADTELQMTKEMLQKYEGQDFEMGYLGQQIVAHTCMLAHLQALKNSGPQELQALVAEGEQAAREHLEQAKQIASQLEDKESGDTNSATRSARSTSNNPSDAKNENKQ